MKRLLILAFVLSAIGAAFWALHQWDKEYRFYRLLWWTTAHYKLNTPAYERLGKQLDQDPLIFGVRHYPPGTPQLELIEREMKVDATPEEIQEVESIDQAIQQQERYEPLLKDMRFSGPIFLQTYPDLPGAHVSTGVGATFDNIDMTGRLMHLTEARLTIAKCPTSPLDHSSGQCAEHLGGSWWMLYEWHTFDAPDEPSIIP